MKRKIHMSTARHREFYPEGVAEVLQGEWILSRNDSYYTREPHVLYMYFVKCKNVGNSEDFFRNQVSEFAVLFGSELDAEVLSLSLELFVTKTMVTTVTLVFQEHVRITAEELQKLKSFHVRLMSIVLNVDADPTTATWDPTKAYLFIPVLQEKYEGIIRTIDWNFVERIINSDAWNNPFQRACPDVYLGTNQQTLGGDRREYGCGKLPQCTVLGQKAHPTYGIRGAMAKFDIVKASGLVPSRVQIDDSHKGELVKGKLLMADSYINAEDLVGNIVTTTHSGKRFYVKSVLYDMDAESLFPKRDGYGIELICKKQPLLQVRGVPYCKSFLSPRERYEEKETESEDTSGRTNYVYLPPELCFVHPLPGPVVRGAQRLPSIMKRIESMLLAIQLKKMIGYTVPAVKILEALTAVSCQESYCYERAELLGDAYLKWVVSKFLFFKYPQKNEGQLSKMRRRIVSNRALYKHALDKGLQSYIQADQFYPSRWAAPGVLPIFFKDFKDQEGSTINTGKNDDLDGGSLDDEARGDGEVERDASDYRVLSTKTLADVVEALIAVYYVEGGKVAASHFMRWIGFEVEFDIENVEPAIKKQYIIPDSVARSVNFDDLEGTLNRKFNDRGLLIEALTHASQPSPGVSCYERLEFLGDAVLDHLITKHLFFTYTDLPPGWLHDLRSAAVNNEYFARLAVRHNFYVHLRHSSTVLETQIRDFVNDVQHELTKSGFNYFGLGNFEAPKVLGDMFESIAAAVFIDSGYDTAAVWQAYEPLLQPIVTPETLPMHPIRELQEQWQNMAKKLEYKATRSGNLTTVEIFMDGVQIGVAQNPERKMAQKLAARNALVTLKKKDDNAGKASSKRFTREALNDMCMRRHWPMPEYRCVSESGPAHAKRYVYSVRINTNDCGWTDEYVGKPMPSVKKAKDSAGILLLEFLNKHYLNDARKQ